MKVLIEHQPEMQPMSLFGRQEQDKISLNHCELQQVGKVEIN